MAATRSGHGQESGVPAVSKRAGIRAGGMEGVSKGIAEELRQVSGEITEGRGVLDSVSFPDGVDLVGWDVFQALDLAGWPAHFNRVNSCRRSQAKMKAQIVLRKITATATHFVELRNSSGLNGDARTDRGAIAFCSGQREEHPVVLNFICVEQ